ncbi:MAG: B12-binding domain-containing radical SAM protein [Planctomycetota bacterium]
MPYLSQALAWISAALENAGHRVTVIDALVEGWNCSRNAESEFTYFGLPLEEIGKCISESDPDLIGIEIPFSTQIETAIQCAGIAREIAPDIPVVVGGNHVTVMAEETAGDACIDYIIAGEGENALVSLADALEKKQKPDAIPGVGFMNENGKFHLTPPDLITDLDALPLPDYRNMPVEKYFDAVGRRQMTIMTSRGCPYNCSFCSVHAVHGHKFRARSAKHVLDEIEILVNEYAVRDLYIEDDNFSFKRDRAEAICSGIVEKRWKLNIYFRNGLRADTLDRKLLGLMRKAGTVKIWLAPESGSRRIREEVIGKKLDLDVFENAVKEAVRQDIGVACFFVIGFPDETRKEIQETLEFAERLRSLGAGSFWFSIATPYYGTKLYEHAKAAGCLKTIDPALLTTHAASIEGEHISSEEIVKIRRQVMEKLNRPVLVSFPRKLMKAIKRPRWALRRLAAKIRGENH